MGSSQNIFQVWGKAMAPPLPTPTTLPTPPPRKTSTMLDGNEANNQYTCMYVHAE